MQLCGRKRGETLIEVAQNRKGGDGKMPQLTADQQAAYDHYLRLIDLYFRSEVHDAGRWWLDRELDELERDMKASGLL
jgi:hypothetical protein